MAAFSERVFGNIRTITRCRIIGGLKNRKRIKEKSWKLKSKINIKNGTDIVNYWLLYGYILWICYWNTCGFGDCDEFTI